MELVPAVVEWNRGPLGKLTDHPLNDKRVQIKLADMSAWIKQSNDIADAILLDIDNGPNALASHSNCALYTDKALACIKKLLNKEGILATWSAARDRDFERRLDDAGFETEIHRVPRQDAEGFREIVYVSQRGRDQ